jgi:hypothetical protein
MEPITMLTYTLTYFVGYYIGNDFYNYYIYRRDHTETINTLDTITKTLRRIETRIQENNN